MDWFPFHLYVHEQHSIDIQLALVGSYRQQSVFTTVKILWSSCNPVYVRERPDKDILASVEVTTVTVVTVVTGDSSDYCDNSDYCDWWQ